MRTTISIQDSLLKRAKEEAIKRRCTLSELVDDALRYRLVEHAGKVLEEAKPLPTYGSGGLRPGVDIADSQALEDVMNEPG